MTTLDCIRVFIASPGDLSEERRMFPAIIDWVNDIKAHSLNCHLEAVGWEDALPGFGRPQEIINADVMNCDVFVMLLWKRWGTTSGSFSSGTEEEFSIAYDRHKLTGVPHLLLYFRSVPEPMMADPGEQLQRVIDFRTNIEVGRICLYKSYDEPNQWKELITKHLCIWLDKRQYGKRFGSAQDEKPDESSIETEQTILNLQSQIQYLSAQLETTQNKLHTEALNCALEAMRYAEKGRITLAEEKFIKSLDLYEEPEVLNAYGCFLFRVGLGFVA